MTSGTPATRAAGEFIDRILFGESATMPTDYRQPIDELNPRVIDMAPSSPVEPDKPNWAPTRDSLARTAAPQSGVYYMNGARVHRPAKQSKPNFGNSPNYPA